MALDKYYEDDQEHFRYDNVPAIKATTDNIRTINRLSKHIEALSRVVDEAVQTFCCCYSRAVVLFQTDDQMEIMLEKNFEGR